MLIRTPDGKVTTIDGRETAPAAMEPTLVLRRRRAARLRRRPLQRPLGRHARHGRHLGAAPSTATGASRSAELLERGDRGSRGRASGWTRCSPRRSTDQPRLLRRRPGDGEDLPRPRRQPPRRRLDAPEPGHGAGLRADRQAGSAGLLPRADRRGDGEDRSGAAARSTTPTTSSAPGCITTKDIGRLPRPRSAPPTKVGYRGLDVYGMRPPSSGGSTVGEALNILEGYEPLGTDRPQILHRFLEASRYAYADRGAYLADPDFFDVPLEGLLSDSLRGRAASADHRPGGAARQGGARESRRERRRRRSPSAESEGTSTTHLTVADSQGHGRLLHVHDRVDGRQRAGGPRVGLPAQQRAHRLRHRRPDRRPTPPRAGSARAARWRRRS